MLINTIINNMTIGEIEGFFNILFTLIDLIIVAVAFLNKKNKQFVKYLYYTYNVKKQINNTTAFPWEENKYQSGRDIHQKYYIKNLNIKNLSDKKSPVKLTKSNNLLFLGKPGSGKSTFLNHLYISQISIPNAFVNVLFGKQYYYVSAKELLSDNIFIFDKLIPQENTRLPIFIFIDGIDEIPIDNIDILVSKMLLLHMKNITLILSCRKEEHNVFLRVNNDYSKVIGEIFEICDWEPSQVNEYIEKYKKYTHNQNFETKIKNFLANDIYSDFLKTPLELSLITFIVDNSDEGMHIENQYELYNVFVTKWIIRECIKTQIKYENTNIISDTFALFSEISYKLFQNEFISSDDDIISQYIGNNISIKYFLNGMLRYERRLDKKYILGFYHLNFQDFFLAYFFCESLTKISIKTIDALKIRYNHSTTKFIKNKFKSMSRESIETIRTNLLLILSKMCKIPPQELAINNIRFSNDIRNFLKALNNDDSIVIRNEIYYFLARLPISGTKNISELIDILRVVYKYEKNVRAKRTIAISATILGAEDIELTYAKELLINEESNHIDRSFTLVYYQDVSHSNPFKYNDDNVCQWTNSRKNRINRLKANDDKSLRMRSFDLITIFNFVKSRKLLYVPTLEELAIIENCDIECNVFSEEKKELLRNVKKDLLNLLY